MRSRLETSYSEVSDCMYGLTRSYSPVDNKMNENETASSTQSNSTIMIPENESNSTDFLESPISISLNQSHYFISPTYIDTLPTEITQLSDTYNMNSDYSSHLIHPITLKSSSTSLKQSSIKDKLNSTVSSPESHRRSLNSLRKSASNILFSSLTNHRDKAKYTIESIFRQDKRTKSLSESNLFKIDQEYSQEKYQLINAHSEAILNHSPVSNSNSVFPRETTTNSISRMDLTNDDRIHSPASPNTQQVAIDMMEGIFSSFDSTIRKSPSHEELSREIENLANANMDPFIQILPSQNSTHNKEETPNHVETSSQSSCPLESVCKMNVSNLYVATKRDEEKGDDILTKVEIKGKNRVHSPSKKSSSPTKKSCKSSPSRNMSLKRSPDHADRSKEWKDVLNKDLPSWPFPLLHQEITIEEAYIMSPRLPSPSLNRSKSFNDSHNIFTPETLLTQFDGKQGISPASSLQDTSLQDKFSSLQSSIRRKVQNRKRRLHATNEMTVNDLSLDIDHQLPSTTDSPMVDASQSVYRKRLSFIMSDSEEFQSTDDLFVESIQSVNIIPDSLSQTQDSDSKNEVAIKDDDTISLDSKDSSILSLSDIDVPFSELELSSPISRKRWIWVKRLIKSIKKIPEIPAFNSSSKKTKNIQSPKVVLGKCNPISSYQSELRKFSDFDLVERHVAGRVGLGFPSIVEKHIYKVSHLKLTQPKQSLVHQVMINNLMLYILSAHYDLQSSIQPMRFMSQPKKVKLPRKGPRPQKTPITVSFKAVSSRRPGRKSMEVSRGHLEENVIEKESHVEIDVKSVQLFPYRTPITPLLKFSAVSIQSSVNDTLQKTKSSESLNESFTKKEKNSRRKSVSEIQNTTHGRTLMTYTPLRNILQDSSINAEEDDEDIPLASLIKK